MNLNKKTSMLCVLRILEKYSDQNHFLTHQDILDKLYSEYNLDLERKAVSSSIKQLTLLGYDINKNPKGGFYLLTREFDESELQFIIDAVYSSRSVTTKQANRLINKLLGLSSIYSRKNYDYIFKSSEITRNKNNKLFLNIELVNDAITSNKKIAFSYLYYNDRGKLVKKDKKYVVNPYYLINNFGRYYLLCSHANFDDITIYRIDFMDDVDIMDITRRDINEVKEFKDFDMGEFINNNIYIFGKEVVDSKIIIQYDYAITYVVDWFGANAKIYKESGITYANIRCNVDALFYWLLQYGEYIEVLTPVEIRNKVKETINIMYSKYNK